MSDAFMITVAVWIIIGVVSAAAGVWAVLLIEQAMQAVRSRREAHAGVQASDEVNERLPEPYRVSDQTISRVATLVFCPVCHPGGHGKCSCVVYCGDRQCGHGPPALFSAEEVAWLEGFGATDEPCDYGQEGNEL